MFGDWAFAKLWQHGTFPKLSYRYGRIRRDVKNSDSCLHLPLLCLTPIMTGISVESKEVNEDTGIGRPNINNPEPSPEVTHPDGWITSRRELWCFYLYYVVRFFSPISRTFFFSSIQRVTMDSPGLTLARPNSRTSSILQAMIQASHRLLNHVAEEPIACYPTWGASGTVRLFRRHLICCTRVAYKGISFLFYYA